MITGVHGTPVFLSHFLKKLTVEPVINSPLIIQKNLC